MKKIQKTFSYLLACGLLFGALALSSCGGSSSSSVSSSASLTLNKSSASLIYGDGLELIATSSSPEAVIAWSSDDAAVATVDAGSVTAVGIGSTAVWATCGEEKASCQIAVTFGDLVPTLVLPHLPGTELSLAQGTSYPLTGQALFNGRYYDCDLAVNVLDKSIATYSGGSFSALKPGTTQVHLAASWNSFSGGLLDKDLTLTVEENVAIYAFVTIGGERKVTNEIDLSLVASWAGETLNNTAALEVGVSEGGVAKTDYAVSYDEDSGVIGFDGATITATGVGSTDLLITHTSIAGKLFSAHLTVNVACPVAAYPNGPLKFSTEEAFPTEEVFGAGATILSAVQGKNALSVNRKGVISGIVAEGDETEAIEIQTTLGGYLFSDVFAYTRRITAANFLSTFQLSDGKIIEGYYILEEDITEPIDVTSQAASYYGQGSDLNTYFAGTFDGQGHSISLKVGHEGAFGGFGDGAIIKNTHFHFTFATDGVSTCGLARNNLTYSLTQWTVTLSNLYVTTANYYLNSYSLMDMRFSHLIMSDIYVKLSGVSELAGYSNSNQSRGALFRLDVTPTYGPYGSYNGDFRNIYVVSEEFIPIADALWYKDSATSRDVIFVCYARNDDSKLGLFFHQGNIAGNNYCVAIPNVGRTDTELFGSLPTATWLTADGILAWVYYASGSIANGGIYRFDKVADLTNFGVTKIGDWTVQ